MSLEQVKKLKNPAFPQCDHCHKMPKDYKNGPEPERFYLPGKLKEARAKYLFPQVELCRACATNPLYDEKYWRAWLTESNKGNVLPTKAFRVQYIAEQNGKAIEKEVEVIARSQDKAFAEARRWAYNIEENVIALLTVRRETIEA